MEALLPTIRQKLSTYTQSIFDLWFADLKLTELTESTAHFTTSTVLRKNILSTRYIGVITEALTEVIGFEVAISIDAEDTNEEFSTHLPFTPRTHVEEEPSEVLVEKARQKEKEITDYINEKKSLVEEYTFDTFIEGASNKFARAACLAVAKEPTTYNPL